MKYYTITEAAKELGTSRQNIHERILKGTLRAKKRKTPTTQGFVWVIPEGDIKYAKEAARQREIRRSWNATVGGKE